MPEHGVPPIGIVPDGKIFAATVRNAPRLVASSWVATSVAGLTQTSKLRFASAGVAIAVSITMASRNAEFTFVMLMDLQMLVCGQVPLDSNCRQYEIFSNQALLQYRR